MFQNIAFIGGVHGSGKGSICKSIAKQLPINHITASEVLNWSEFSPVVNNKLVNEITQTQDKLIAGLRAITKEKESYLLDGHYCLLNSHGKVNRVPTYTFEQINPVLLSVVKTDPEIIKARLEARDGIKYDLTLLSEMQLMEVEYAIEISNSLEVPLVELDTDILPLTTALYQKLNAL